MAKANFLGKYEAKMEFSEGLGEGVEMKKPFVCVWEEGGGGDFLEQHNACSAAFNKTCLKI